MTKAQQMDLDLKLVAFRDAAQNLSEAWERANDGDLLTDDYPFEHDFETMVLLISEWVFAAQQKENRRFIGRQFELNNFICTITNIAASRIYYTFENKAGNKLGAAELDISFMPKIIAQLKQSNQ